MLLAFLTWWYTSGWVGCFNRWVERYRNLAEYFSVSTLFATFFNPFRQISYRAANKSLDARFHTMLENLFSRLMGSIVRTMIIFAALIVYILALPLFIAEVLLWPLIPLMWLIIPAIVILFGGQV